MTNDQPPEGAVPDESRPTRREELRRRRRRRRSPWILIATGALLVAGVGAWQLYATVWTTHANDAGKALVHGFLHHHRNLGSHAAEAPLTTPSAPKSTTGKAALASCTGSGSSTPVHGLLEIPKLGVVAPVEQGVGDGQLSVAVGHDPYSVWPGGKGNAVLQAHDVTYFASLAKLSTGDVVRYVTPCTTYVFKVTSHAIVKQGSPVYNTATPAITMVTCWPTDALWFTPDRYLVTASEVSTTSTGGSPQTYLTASTPPSVPVPSTLASQGVTLSTYSLPMGTFTLAGSPDHAWAQTTSPLLVEGSAVEAFIAGVRALGENQLGWWHDVAPGVTAPAPLVGAGNPGYLSGTDVTEQATGTKVTSVTLSVAVSVSGGSAPGQYSVSVHEHIHDNTLTISSWSMSAS